jgi:hypothetical protein
MTERTIQQIVADLTEPVAASDIKTRPQGGSNIHYIEWHTACQYLDKYAAGWSWQIESVEQIDKSVVVHGSLAIPSASGLCVRHATGVEDVASKGYGDPFSNASAMAFKRAAAMFGLGRHLYSKDVPKPQQTRPAPNRNDWRVGLAETIKLLTGHGIPASDIQQRMVAITGCQRRDELNDAKGLAFLRVLETWVGDLENDQ